MPPDQQITAVALKIDGVSDLDPEGYVPSDILIDGTLIRIPRWSRFPPPPAPGEAAKYTILHIYWQQNNAETEIVTKTYTYVDDQPEFTFPLTPQQMSSNGTAFIRYVLEGFDGNDDPSPVKKLTILHASLSAPVCPDVDIWNTLHCYSDPPVSEKIRVRVNPESVFAPFDDFVIEWQGFATRDGKPPALTQLFKFNKKIDANEAVTGFVFDVLFDPYIRPMFDNHSGRARYIIFRNGTPIYKSSDVVVLIHRKIAGEPVPCGGYP